MQTYLIKSNNKRSIRLYLRQEQLLHAKRSSVYTLDNYIYLVIKSSNLESINQQDLAVLTYDNASFLEQKILLWASAEIDKTIDFIQFETNSILDVNGRTLKYNEGIITRTFGHLAELMLVLNYNNNSFSDGGKYNTPDSACSRIIEQLELGATIIDIGIESTRYVGSALSAEHEIKQLKILLPHIISLKHKYKFLISIDTYHPATIEYLLNLDVDLINDVSGKLPLKLVKECTLANKKYVGMHSLTIPTDKSIIIDLKLDPISVICKWMKQLINDMDKLNINLQYIILDPGVGFGKSATQDWFILKNITQFHNISQEILLGHSRKWFHSHIMDLEIKQRDLPTSIIAASLIKHVDYVRMHDLTNLTIAHNVIHELN